MIVEEMEQGTTEWERRRMGRPTVSGYSSIVTPSDLKYAAAAESYRARLLAEWMLDKPLESKPEKRYNPETGTYEDFRDRGKQQEEDAAHWYAFREAVTLERVGFVRHDTLDTGGSPDRFVVGERRGVEFKVPSAHVHMACLLGKDPDYLLQVQGYLWLTGFESWDIVSWNPDLPPVVIRHYPEDEVQEALEKHVSQFCRELEQAKRYLTALGPDGRREDRDPETWKGPVKLRLGEEGDPDELSIEETAELVADLEVAVRGQHETEEGRQYILQLAFMGRWREVRDSWAAVRRRMMKGGTVTRAKEV